ncbi:MAG: helix-turn-helix domain-containing protein [Tepidisphaeraceae bacterium]
MPSNNPTIPRIAVSEFDAGKLLSLSGKTLQRLRVSGRIKFFRASAGGKVLYRLAELERFAKSREVAQ